MKQYYSKATRISQRYYMNQQLNNIILLNCQLIFNALAFYSLLISFCLFGGLNTVNFSQLIINQLGKVKKAQMKESQAHYQMQEKSSKRRMTTDCNYSVLSTLLMRFLKEKDKQAYRLSRELAKRNKISEEKNYSIIFLRVALYLHRKNQENLDRWEVVSDLFQWLEIQVDDCVNSKYKDNLEEFKRLAKKKIREILSVIRRVFEDGDLGNPLHIKDLVINIYEKKGKDYSKTHEKMASNLAHLIVGIIFKGDQYLEKEEIIEGKKGPNTVGALSQCEGDEFSNPAEFSSTLLESNFKPTDFLENLCSENQLYLYSSKSLEYWQEESTPLLDLNFFEDHKQPAFMMMEVEPVNSFFY